MFIQETLLVFFLFVFSFPLCVGSVLRLKTPSTPVLLQALSILLDYSCAYAAVEIPAEPPRGAALSFMKWGLEGGVAEKCVHRSTCFKL